MGRKRKNKKPKYLSQNKLKEYTKKLNDQSLRIKRVSRDFFKDADIGTRKHKDKKRYNRKPKYKKDWEDEE